MCAKCWWTQISSEQFWGKSYDKFKRYHKWNQCVLQYSPNCHFTKRGKHYCRACYAVAPPQVMERLKEYDEGYCNMYECWKAATEPNGRCKAHKNSKHRAAPVLSPSATPPPAATPTLGATSPAPQAAATAPAAGAMAPAPGATTQCGASLVQTATTSTSRAPATWGPQTFIKGPLIPAENRGLDNPQLHTRISEWVSSLPEPMLCHIGSECMAELVRRSTRAAPSSSNAGVHVCDAAGNSIGAAVKMEAAVKKEACAPDPYPASHPDPT